MEYSEGTYIFCAFSESSKVLYLSRWKLCIRRREDKQRSLCLDDELYLNCLEAVGAKAMVVGHTLSYQAEHVAAYGELEVLEIRGDKASVIRSNCDSLKKRSNCDIDP
ncbi:BnaCnng75870D [Brassica napus]|uniref:BnaCnng75870D protein n=1 Tax=Brassica napus TaxID=3708 RepID=A0A078K2P9_BRANA|nr:BnaCnng75870D [Brassica napus]